MNVGSTARHPRVMTARRARLLLLLALSGCTAETLTGDGAAPDEKPSGGDMGPTQDLAVADRSPLDQGTADSSASDLEAPDFSIPPDLVTVADLATPDLSKPIPDFALPDLTMPADLSTADAKQPIGGPCSIDNDCQAGWCICNDGQSPGPCQKGGMCCGASCPPHDRCDPNNPADGCVCDAQTCQSCCTISQDGVCNPYWPGPICYDAYNRDPSCPLPCETGAGNACLVCPGDLDDYECDLQLDGAPYCAAGVSTRLACAGGCVTPSLFIQWMFYCHNGDLDTECGTNGDDCVSCPMAKHCVNHACQ